jgi:hypothetical protein
MDVDPVETGVDRATSRRGKCINRLGYVVFTGFLDLRSGQWVGHGRWGDRSVSGHTRLASGVSELRQNRGAFGMHLIGQSSQPSDLFVSVNTGLAAGVPAPGVGEHMTGDDGAHRVGCEPSIELD